MLRLGSKVRRLLYISYRAEDKKFAQALKQPQQAFESKFAEYQKVLPDLSQIRSYRDFAERLPITQYSDVADLMESAVKNPPAQWAGDALVRFESTSGSTQKRKFLAYNRRFLGELDRALGPWLVDLARQYPATLEGKHYWSLSWVPQAERNEGRSNDDTELFAWWKRPLLSLLMAVPQNVAQAPTNHEWLIATLRALVSCRDLSLISVWSPTFFIQLAQSLIQHRDEVMHGLSAHDAWRLKNYRKLQDLWPQLACLSCWDSASSAQFLPALRELLPSTPIQGKGLWATEGVVTIPYGNRHVPALTSHLVEYCCEATQKILGPWQLEKDQVVRPLITNGAGLLRYDLRDRLRVRSIDDNRLPDLSFAGRERVSDLAGEKLHDADLSELVVQLEARHAGGAISLLRIVHAQSGQGQYLLLAKKGSPRMAEEGEAELLKHHHYRVARELNQLRPLGLINVAQPIDAYEKIRLQSGQVASTGQIKIEAVLSTTDGDLRKLGFLS